MPGVGYPAVCSLRQRENGLWGYSFNWKGMRNLHRHRTDGGPALAGFLLSLTAAVMMGARLEPAQAQQPVRPLPKSGSCPIGYFSSGSYCVPSNSGNTRGAIEKSGNSCPIGFYSSGHYCVSSPNNNREAIQKQGSSCPMGWFSSGRYCVQSR